MESVCVPIRPGHVLMPNMRNFSAHHSLCRKFHGVTSVVDSQNTQDDLIGELGKNPQCFQIGTYDGRLLFIRQLKLRVLFL